MQIDLRTEALTSNKGSTIPEGNKRSNRNSTELEPELPEQNRWWRRRRLKSKPKFGEQGGPRLFGGGGFEPVHGSTAADTSIKICPEHMSQQPGPTLTGRASVGSLGAELGELKLVARGRRRLESGRILWRLGDYFGAELGVA